MSSEARTIAAIALWLGAILVGFYATQGDDAPVVIDTSTTLAQTTTTVEANPATSTTIAPATTLPTTTTTTTVPLEAGGALVVATLENGQFTLSGVVPDLETKGEIEAAAETVYLGGVSSSLEVVADAETPDFFTAVPRAVTLLPIIGNGTITIGPQGASAVGSAPNGELAAAFAGELQEVLGVAIAEPAIEVTGAGFPTLNVRRQGATITLAGTFASAAAQASVVDGAVAVYGADAVVDSTTIDESLDVPYWTYTMPAVFQLLAPFSDYEIDVLNGVTVRALNDAASFAVDSAQLTRESQEPLTIAQAILARDPAMGIRIAGHTDATGPANYNMMLSEARAAAAAAWLAGAGIDAARIVTVGYGEGRPIASNDTEAGKASNRRVEFVFGPVGDIVGG